MIIDKSIFIDGLNSAGSGTRVTFKSLPFRYISEKNRIYQYRVFTVESGKVVLKNMTITDGLEGGDQPAEGGGIFIAESAEVLLENVIIENCRLFGVGAAGGGIYNLGLLTMRTCKIQFNSSSNDTTFGFTGVSGGGIWNGGMLHMSGCEIRGNVAHAEGDHGGVNCGIVSGADGGGLSLSEGTVVLDKCVVSENRAETVLLCGSTQTSVSGGGIIIGSQIHSFELLNSTVANNTADISIRFSDNGKANVYGAGIINYASNGVGNVSIVNSTICGNRNIAKTLSLTKSAGTRSFIYTKGSGIYSPGYLQMTSSTVAGNIDSSSFFYISKSIRNKEPISGSCCVFNNATGFCGNATILNSIIAANGRGDGDLSIQTSPENDTLSSIAAGTVTGTLDSVTLSLIRFIPGCQTSLSALSVFGTDSPKPADYGGTTPTVRIPDSSVAAAHGVRVGKYMVGDTSCYDAYFTDGVWRSLATGSTVSGVEEILYDQRGVLREDPPCAGAYYVKPSVAVKRHAPYHQTLQPIILQQGPRGVTFLRGCRELMAVTVFSMDGRVIRHFPSITGGTIELKGLPRGIVIVSVLTKTRTEIVRLNRCQ